ncbi:phage tail protein [Pasteurella skyensis]|uniref:Phage tail protein n=1 Tax=Phocoenobacter skyensis TaxID=97481 RepID=A0AAJ6P379_9PAST|nr:phage tail protein [Pasteurella skyensis]MDP8171619.1 phage tail protein [Pasteurella skyensis]MDP8175455.1 phage tail protein [Pasteurella skyensis]
MAEIQAYKIKLQQGVSLVAKDYEIYRSELPRVTNHFVKKQGVLSGNLGFLNNREVCSYVVPNYYSDLYLRVLVIPHVVDLGSIATSQTFTVQVWNANKHDVTLTSIQAFDGEGIEIIGEKLPIKMQSLALKKWTVKVSMTGPASIDCLIEWKFLNHSSVTLNITGSRSTDWAFFPDWTENVVENIEFLTRVHQSLTGAEQRIARRLSPRRTFEFKVTTTDVERQKLNNALYAYGARVWSLPVFTDKAFLTKAVKSGDKEIFIKTTGYDFNQKGRALFMLGHQKEMVEIIEVDENKITLKRPVINSFSLDTAVYPLRSAILTDMPRITHLSDGVSSSQVRFQIYENNDYSSDISYLPTYRNHPVLEPTSEWSEDVTAQYLRLIHQLDNETGLPFQIDIANKAFQVISHRFVLTNRQEQHKLRQLFYYLKGRQKAIWVASACTDLTVVKDIQGKSIDIQFIDYSTALVNQTGRTNIRIECADGSIYYRQIINATVVDDGTERLTLDGDILNIKQHHIAKISFLTLSRLESDTISWQHHTDADGTATVTVSFYGLRDELEV